MSFASDDLTPLLIPPPTQAVRYGQGTILEWNPETFENQIRWRGVILTNLPVLAGTDALTFTPGEVVGLLGWAPSEGSAGSWWILGRVILPGAGRAAEIIRFMQTTLAREIALEVFGEAIAADRNPDFLSITSSTWDDPGVGQPGPTLTGVTIGNTGECLVMLSGDLDARVPEEQVGQVQMSVEISGATNRAPGTDVVLALGRSVSGTGNFDLPTGEMASVGLVQNLNPGAHTFHAQYQNTIAADNSFINRATMIVIPF